MFRQERSLLQWDYLGTENTALMAKPPPPPQACTLAKEPPRPRPQEASLLRGGQGAGEGALPCGAGSSPRDTWKGGFTPVTAVTPLQSVPWEQRVITGLDAACLRQEAVTPLSGDAGVGPFQVNSPPLSHADAGPTPAGLSHRPKCRWAPRWDRQTGPSGKTELSPKTLKAPPGRLSEDIPARSAGEGTRSAPEGQRARQTQGTQLQVTPSVAWPIPEWVRPGPGA